MKTTILSLFALCVFQPVFSQVWAPVNEGGQLSEIEAAYGPTFKSKRTDLLKSGEFSAKSGEIKPEGKNYHYKRWMWYWQRHLDAQGYMVGPAKNFAEAQRATRMQALSKTTNGNMSNWAFSGPTTSESGYHGIGRINVISFHPTNAGTYMIGSAGGGVWRTTTDGATWTPLTDNLPVLGVSDIDYNPQNPQTIYLCTGDRDGSDTYSIGVLKSTDGGVSWDTTGLQYDTYNFVLTNCLLIDPNDTSSLLLATSGGIMRSTDAGATWNTVTTGNFKQIVRHPTDPTIVYGATAGGGSANIFRSIDNGLNWSAATAFTNATRIALAVSPAEPNAVKAVVANTDNGLHGVYSSLDDGASFYKIYGNDGDCYTNILSHSFAPDAGDCGGQGWYDLTIAVNPLNASEVTVGGVNTWHSTDGGNSFFIATQWYNGNPGVMTVHADKHYHTYNPLNPGVLYEANDGGIYKTSNPYSMLWTDISNGLGITQFYRIATSDLTDFVVGGAQDNGTKGVSFAGAYQELTGGDGMDCQMDWSDPDVFYTSSQFGYFNRTTDGGQSFSGISDNIPDFEGGEWITPLLLSPADPYTIYMGLNHVYMSNDRGDTWTDISPNMSASQLALRLTMSAGNTERIWGLWNNNTIRYTANGGANWTSLSHPLSWITDIQADPLDEKVLWATVGGYTGTRVARYEVGVGWSNESGALPDVPVNCFVKDTANNTLYVGTDIGVYFRDTITNTWSPYKTNLPTAEVIDLSINYATNELWAATYGRGMWHSPRSRDTTEVDLGIWNAGGPLSADVIQVAPNPTNGTFAVLTDNEGLRGKVAELKIIALNGQVMDVISAQFDGSGRLQAQTGRDLSPGLYLLQIEQNGIMCGRTKLMIRP